MSKLSFDGLQKAKADAANKKVQGAAVDDIDNEETETKPTKATKTTKVSKVKQTARPFNESETSRIVSWIENYVKELDALSTDVKAKSIIVYRDYTKLFTKASAEWTEDIYMLLAIMDSMVYNGGRVTLQELIDVSAEGKVKRPKAFSWEKIYKLLCKAEYTANDVLKVAPSDTEDKFCTLLIYRKSLDS